MAQDKNVTLTPNGARKLADALIRRRTELGIRSARSMGSESGLDYRTITNLEACRRTEVSRNTLAVLEMHLKWPAGYLNALLESADQATGATTVQLVVPEGADMVDVERAKKVAQETFNSILKQMQGF